MESDRIPRRIANIVVFWLTIIALMKLKFNRLKPKSVSLLLLFCYSMIFGGLKAQDNAAIDSLLHLSETTSVDTIKIEALNELSWAEVHRNPEQGLEYGREALVLSQKIKWKRGEAFSQKYLGNNYHELGQHDEAMLRFEAALALFRELGIRSTEAATLGNIGTLYEDIDNYPKAVEYHLKSLKIKEEDGNKRGMAYSYMGLGNIHQKMERVDEALDYHHKSLALFTEANDPLNISTCYYNISGILHAQGKFEEALASLDSVAVIFEQFQHYTGLTTVLQGQAILLEELDRFEEADEMYTKAVSYAKQTGDLYAEAICLVNIGKLRYETGKLSDAIQCYQDAILIADELGNKDVLLNAFENLSKIHKESNSFEEALLYKELQFDLKDSLFNVENSAVLEELKLQFNNEKTERELLQAEAVIKEERAANAEHELKNAEQSKWLIASVAGICLLIVVALGFYRVYRLKKKAGEELLANQQIIEERNRKIELLLGEIHHRVKNNLQVISSLLSLQERNVEDKGAKEALMEGKERVRSIGMIHKLLYQNDNFTGIDMKEYIQELVDSLKDSFYPADKGLELDVDFDAIKLDVDSAVTVGLIINELVLNALKYAYEKTDVPALRVKLAEDQKELVLTVQDNGSGTFAAVEGSKSFGLKLVRSLTRQLSGTMDVKENEGLRFDLRFKDFKVVN